MFLAESRWWPLVILAPLSAPPREEWWRCQWAASPRRDARVCWGPRPDWRRAGGSPRAGTVGSAGGSRRTQTAARPALRQRRLQELKKQNSFIWSCACWFNFSPCGGENITLSKRSTINCPVLYCMSRSVHHGGAGLEGDERRPGAAQ